MIHQVGDYGIVAFTTGDLIKYFILMGFFFYWPAIIAIAIGWWRAPSFLSGFGMLFVGVVLSNLWVLVYLAFDEQTSSWATIRYELFFAALYCLGYLVRQTIRHARLA